MTENPTRRFAAWWRAAKRSGEPLWDACVLATADRHGRPSARFVLLKGVDERGFSFFTNLRSRKARELHANPHAALVFYWHDSERQVRIEGSVKSVSPAEADAYWLTRPRERQLAAFVSDQSATLSSRSALLSAFRNAERTFKGRSVPRPRGWSGFRIVPATIEFWTRGEHRLHHRELFVRRRGRWTKTLLFP